MSKSFVCQNDETTEDDKAGNNEVEEFPWFPGELKSRASKRQDPGHFFTKFRIFLVET